MENNCQKNVSQPQESCILVCQYRSCLAAGSAEVLEAFNNAEVENFQVKGTGCQGQCSIGPTVRIVPEETWYYRVKPSDVPVIVEEHLKGGKPVEAKLNPRIHIRFSF
ncbi:NAD(P)H-dependent oxidoreductase subunit E [Lyngbya aestuarii]|uniref:NAD(P)H-dependent oxidoreductase subunit E n=1 Tax=Lyngbya aestuarii TaxID=118322 RepID=UPI00403DFC32